MPERWRVRGVSCRLKPPSERRATQNRPPRQGTTLELLFQERAVRTSVDGREGCPASRCKPMAWLMGTMPDVNARYGGPWLRHEWRVCGRRSARCTMRFALCLRIDLPPRRLFKWKVQARENDEQDPRRRAAASKIWHKRCYAQALCTPESDIPSEDWSES